ncbi:ion channel [Ruegeria sp. 2205SS24-7]|uniref:potassium channel family protein n=1 Tax=Ruegeria discodermiae TaxID=3064389 RepID=UPI0027416FE2|nr:potassium channel family protein [Ruegeria sp. 2205SS24-7]MDP5216228.1 ion channel [Ruegeria sp. 2205SS24-7]
MSLPHQIVWGSLYLGICFVVEIMLLVWCTLILRSFGKRYERHSISVQAGGLISIALFFIVLAHTIQVWVWAVAWMMDGTLADWNESLYFSLVTYTTLGYGDIVLGPDLRIFAAFSAVAGLLAFGLSTAYLVALMSMIFDKQLRPND